jgi:hypothetical protein
MIPNRIRLKKNGSYFPVTDLLSESIIKNQAVPYQWLNEIVFTKQMIRPLVEKCRRKLPELLLFLSGRQFVQTGFGKPLIVQDIQRILKIARESDDQRMITGAIIALSESRYIRSAKMELLCKLLQVIPAHASFASTLFKRAPFGHGLDPDEIDIVADVAKEVCDSSQAYPFEVVCNAAAFLVEHRSPQLSSLRDLETSLGITTVSVSEK